MLEQVSLSASVGQDFTRLIDPGNYLGKDELQKMADRTKKAMEKAAKELEFIEAARLRDDYLALQKLIEEKK